VVKQNKNYILGRIGFPSVGEIGRIHYLFRSKMKIGLPVQEEERRNKTYVCRKKGFIGVRE